MQQVKHAGGTNNADGSVTQSVSAGNTLTWISPAENEVFEITEDASLPDMIFEFRSQIAGEYKWSWTIEWEAKTSGLRERARKGDVLQIFKESGSFVSNTKWKVDFSGKVLGGKLTVAVKVGQKNLVRTVIIKGQNPSGENVATYVGTLEDMDGFEKLLEQETNCKHFIDLDGEPIVALTKAMALHK